MKFGGARVLTLVLLITKYTFLFHYLLLYPKKLRNMLDNNFTLSIKECHCKNFRKTFIKTTMLVTLTLTVVC